MNETRSNSNKFRWIIAVAAVAAVLIPITAFAGIGAWNGVQRVFLGSAIEMEPVAEPVEPAEMAEAAEPAEAAESAEPAQSAKSTQSYSNDRKAGFLGVSTTSITNQLRDSFGVPKNQGVMITEVNDDSAAQRAGLQAGDVIVSVDGTTINDSGDLGRAIRNSGADTTVNLGVIRDHQSLDFAATLGVNESRHYRVYRSRRDRDDGHDGHDGDDDGNHFSWNSNDWTEEDRDRFEARMEEFGERMAEWGERFGETFGERFENEFERNGEEFGRRMEAWGEEFGRRMEEKFENGDWDKHSFHFRSEDGDFNEEEFAEAMEKMHEHLADIDLEGIGAMVEHALSAIDWQSINSDVSRAMEDAMRALDDLDKGGNRK